MSTTSRTSSRTQEGSASPLVVLLVALLSFAAGVAVTWWYLSERATTMTASVPSPAPDFGPLTPGAAASTPAPAPEASPSAVVADAAPPTTAVAAPPKAPAGAPKAAAPLPKRVPKPPVASPVPAPPPVSEAARSFVLGATVVESLRSVGRDLDGFETSGIGVKRAPKIEGQIDLVMQPATVEAGKPYSVMVYLKNDGKKSIDVEEMKVSMIVDGKWSTRPLPSKVKQVPPKQRVLLEELPGIWKGGVNDWAVEAVVTSKNQDVYRNRLTWK
jgi:archaellum component FlaG (FlaF/FlaG flagellin family)